MEDKYVVSSEIYEEFNYATDCKPMVNSNNIVSRFPFSCPDLPPLKDSDGDFVVQRKSCSDTQLDFIEIEHSKRTILGMVGLQVWRGALLLADWLFYNGCNLPKESMILELGSGTGLTSTVAAMYAPVICTDINKGDILKLVEANVARNKALIRYPIKVIELDFTSNSFNAEITTVLPQVQVVLAADVVYDNELTEAFVKTIQHILAINTKCIIYVALEKRFVFTLEDCDIIAPCYEYFLDCVNNMKDVVAEEMSTDFPQKFIYDRVKELVLWKISSTAT